MRWLLLGVVLQNVGVEVGRVVRHWTCRGGLGRLLICVAADGGRGGTKDFIFRLGFGQSLNQLAVFLGSVLLSRLEVGELILEVLDMLLLSLTERSLSREGSASVTLIEEQSCAGSGDQGLLNGEVGGIRSTILSLPA